MATWKGRARGLNDGSGGEGGDRFHKFVKDPRKKGRNNDITSGNTEHPES